MHPKIAAMMIPYLKKFRRVQLKKLMEKAGVTWNQIPTLPNFMTASNENGLCYNWVLGQCQDKYCFCKDKTTPAGTNHPSSSDLPDTFATQLVTLLQNGATHIYQTEEGRKRKRVKG